MATTPDSEPPEYTPRVVYDETHRGKWYAQLDITSMAQVPHIIAYLQHHSPDSDGSFAICIANGQGIFVSKVISFQDLPNNRPCSTPSRKLNDPCWIPPTKIVQFILSWVVLLRRWEV